MINTNHRLALLPLLSLMAGGCTDTTVWEFHLDAAPQTSERWAPVDNFTASVIVDEDEEYVYEGPWENTYEDEYEVNAYVYELGRGQRFLEIGSLTLVGEEDDDGTWIFTRTINEVEEEWDTHSAGYRYGEVDESSVTITYTLDFDGDTVSGERTYEYVESYLRYESDRWDTSAEQIPRSSNMSNYWTVDDATYTFPENEPDAGDCDADPCFEGVKVTTVYEGTVEGVKMTYDDESAGE